MRVAFVSTILGCPWGGADKLWTQAAEDAAAAGHGVLVAVAPAVAEHPRMKALAARGARFHLRDGFTVHNGWRARLRQGALRRLRSPRSLLAALDRFQPDFVFVCQGGAFDLLLEEGLMRWLDEKARRFALICQSNAEDERLSPEARAAVGRAADRAEALVFVSSHNRELAERQLGRALPRARLVQNPVELAAPAALPWPGAQAARFAAVARLDIASKGFDLLIDALALALAGEDGWRLDFFGRGSDEGALRERTERAGLGDRIRFAGFSADVASIWREHHLLLLPSRREGCSLAMLEALACGRPVLATRVGGVSDWIEEGATGFVCPGPDAASLAATLKSAWNCRSTWPSLGAAAARSSAARRDPRPGSTLLSLIA